MLATVIFSCFAFGQVGINNTSHKATLDIFHMVKMLDGAQLMREREIEKIKNKPADDPE